MSLGKKVVLAVVLGTLLGAVLGSKPFVFGISTHTFGALGFLVIRMLKALAIPLIFFAILDSIPKAKINKTQLIAFFSVCLFNVCVAMGIGLLIMNVFSPGTYWATHFSDVILKLKGNTTLMASPSSLSVLQSVSSFIPDSILSPFVHNSVISVVVLALLFGFALNSFLKVSEPDSIYFLIYKGCEAMFQIVLRILEWVISLVPYAVFGMVSDVVSKTGLGVYKMLWIFLLVLILGLFFHSCIYYPLLSWLVGKKSPKTFFSFGRDAILTGFSTNSSLATVPLTLKSLRNMGVSDQSARISACIGTNFNNDGIALYEAMAAIFILQAFGVSLDLSTQLMIVFTSILAGWGMAGIPEAGLVMLPIVLSNTSLPPQWIAVIIPLIVPVDWIIARCRSAVNVMSDLTVAIVIDRVK